MKLEEVKQEALKLTKDTLRTAVAQHQAKLFAGEG
jgi:hypothetical protein